MATVESTSSTNLDGRRATLVVEQVKRKKLTKFGNWAKGLMDPVILPIVDKHWGFTSILIIGTMLVVIAIAGALLQLVFPAGSPGTALQAPYDFLRSLGPDGHVLYTIMLTFGLYLLLVFFYTLLDVCRPAWIQKHFMIQPRPAMDFGGEALGFFRTVKSQCRAYAHLVPVYTYISLNNGPHTYTRPWVEPCYKSCWVELPEAAPSVTEFLVHAIFCLALNDVTYWYYHWMCHRHRALYKNIHSMHHEYKQPFAMVGAHLHPQEFMATFLFALVPPIACRAHPFTVWVCSLVGTCIGIEAHSGYTGSPFSWVMERLTCGVYGGTEHHDVHHETPWCNYQPYFGYLDILCGTDAVTVARDEKKS